MQIKSMFQASKRAYSTWLAHKQAATVAQLAALEALGSAWPSRADLVHGLALDLLVAQSTAEQSLVIGAPLGAQFALMAHLPQRSVEYGERMAELNSLEFAIQKDEEVRMLANSPSAQAMAVGAQMHLIGLLPIDVRPALRDSVLKRNRHTISVLCELDQLLNRT